MNFKDLTKLDFLEKLTPLELELLKIYIRKKVDKSK